MKIRIRSGLAVLAIAAVASFAIAPVAQAKIYHLHFTLAGKAETPPNDATGKGHGTATYNDKTNVLKYDVVYKGLTGDAKAAHFHGPAKEGEKADVQVPIKDVPLTSPIKGEATITEDQGKDLLAGLWYFNIHTEANGGGELRGQVLKSGAKKAAS
jgi:hypothetical protein